MLTKQKKQPNHLIGRGCEQLVGGVGPIGPQRGECGESPEREGPCSLSGEQLKALDAWTLPANDKMDCGLSHPTRQVHIASDGSSSRHRTSGPNHLMTRSIVI